MRMRVQIVGGIASVLIGATWWPAFAAPRVGKPEALPRPPVCEPSAALAVPCSGAAAATCVWVGDNEQDDRLFQYRIGEQGLLALADEFDLKPKGLEVGDVEALARTTDGVLVFGSHSRKSDCTDDHGRAALARVSADGKQAEALAGKKGFEDRIADCSDWVELDEAATDAARALQKRFCSVVGASERMNNAVEGDKQNCPGTAFNIEGALSVEQGGKLRTWVGLRAPLVDGHAVLLRVADPPAVKKKRRLQFDGIATVDLGQRGIRELSVAGGTIWGIAGCVPDCSTPSRLWRIDAGKLASGATIAAAEAGVLADVELPASAEGLVVQAAEKRAVVLVDGDKGKSDDACSDKTPPQQLTIDDLP